MLENLIGHQKVKALLSSMLESQKIPHVFLFHGEAGVGKKTFANAFARALVQTKNVIHPDIRVYSLDEKSDLHTIASMRELKEEVYLPPFEAKHKVFIINDAHKMLPSASQALLKTLEEPSLYCKIILLTESVADLLPTIVSRCCKIAFSPLYPVEIEHFLVHHHHVDKEIAEKISHNAFGSLERAMSFIGEEGRLWRESLLELLLGFKTLPFDKIQEHLSLLEEQIEKAVTCSIENIYEVILRYMRDLTVVKERLDSNLLFFKDKEDLLKIAANNNTLSFDSMHKLWQSAKQSSVYHVKFKVALETLLLRLYEKDARIHIVT